MPIGIAHPHHDRQVGRVAVRPRIAVVVRGARLRSRRTVLQDQRRIAPIGEQLGRWIGQDARDHVRRARVQHLLARGWLVIDQHVPRRIHDPADGHQRNLAPVVGERCIHLRHVDRADLGPAQRQAQPGRLARIRAPGGDAQARPHVDGCRYADELERLHGRDVDRVAQRASHRHSTVKLVIEVARAPLVARLVLPAGRLVVEKTPG